MLQFLCARLCIISCSMTRQTDPHASIEPEAYAEAGAEALNIMPPAGRKVQALARPKNAFNILRSRKARELFLEVQPPQSEIFFFLLSSLRTCIRTTPLSHTDLRVHLHR